MFNFELFLKIFIFRWNSSNDQAFLHVFFPISSRDLLAFEAKINKIKIKILNISQNGFKNSPKILNI